MAKTGKYWVLKDHFEPEAVLHFLRREALKNITTPRNIHSSETHIYALKYSNTPRQPRM